MWGIPGRFDQAVTLTFFSFKYVMDDHKKKTYTNFYIFLDISDSNSRNRRDMRAVINFENYTINSLMTKKISKLISSCPELYFR